VVEAFLRVARGDGASDQVADDCFDIQGINLHGEYDFSEAKMRDSVGLDLSRILALDLS